MHPSNDQRKVLAKPGIHIASKFESGRRKKKNKKSEVVCCVQVENNRFFRSLAVQAMPSEAGVARGIGSITRLLTSYSVRGIRSEKFARTPGNSPKCLSHNSGFLPRQNLLHFYAETGVLLVSFKRLTKTGILSASFKRLNASTRLCMCCGLTRTRYRAQSDAETTSLPKESRVHTSRVGA
ncbi:hypothetical protein ARMSODRAFT_211679 [Armillaria solidipes]|uniref:Uncharacterized protein n=1 Tax=Armillaria solidipes TaxID=1076256 RepID=A0A2H3BBK3_9AGAR|nr:hypothetical protein ARMSODRAFT_211679 [Armillaria solidipes]